MNNLDAEQQRAVQEGLNEDELALFDLIYKENISKVDRERLKQASKTLFGKLKALLKPTTTDGTTIRLRRVSTPDQEAQHLLEKLKIKLPERLGTDIQM